MKEQEQGCRFEPTVGSVGWCERDGQKRLVRDVGGDRGRQEESDKAPHPFVGTARQQRAVGIFLIQLHRTEIQIHRRDVLHEMETFKDLQKMDEAEVGCWKPEHPCGHSQEGSRGGLGNRDRLQCFWPPRTLLVLDIEDATYHSFTHSFNE